MHTLTCWTKPVGLLGFLLLLGHFCRAQVTPPTLDGIISPGEYGAHTNGQNQQQTNSGFTTWYMTWDDTNLYVAVAGGNQTTEGAVIYLDKNPIVPVNGGSNSSGSVAGFSYDNAQFATLPTRADYVLYTKETYDEHRNADGAGRWSALDRTGIAKAYSASSQTREIQIPWAQLGGRPASFNWFGYLVSASGSVYAPAPTGNPIGTVGTAATASYYYTVSNTAAGAATTPFSQTSFAVLGTQTASTLGELAVYDLTVNTATGVVLKRARTGNNWDVSGALTVAGPGTLSFGSEGGQGYPSYGTTTARVVRVLSGATLDLDFTTNPLVVSDSARVSGTLQLSSSTSGNGDLRLAGNLLVTSSGSVVPSPYSSARSVVLTGSAQTLLGSPRLTLNKLLLQQQSNGTATLGSNATITGTLTFGTGQLLTGAYTVSLGDTGSLVSESSTSNIVGFASSLKSVGSGGSGAVNFGGLGLTLQTINKSSQLGTTLVVRSRGLAPFIDDNGRQSTQRNYRVVPSSSGGTYEVNLQFSYFDSELNNLPEGTLGLFSSRNAVTRPTSGTGTFSPVGVTGVNTLDNVLTRNGVSELGTGLSTGIVFTLSSQNAPLPVTLASFEGERVAAGVRLTWLTALELDNAGFGIERQELGGSWQAIGFVPGAGNGLGHSYEYLDAAAPASSTLYYRLRQTDLSGAVSYSPVVAVAPAAADLGSPTLLLSPVPVSADQATLAVDLSTLPAAPRTLAVYDLQGRLLLRSTAPAAANSTTLSLPRLAAGMYLVLVRSGGASFRARFSKL